MTLNPFEDLILENTAMKKALSSCLIIMKDARHVAFQDYQDGRGEDREQSYHRYSGLDETIRSIEDLLKQ
jgi:hypothetical protein